MLSDYERTWRRYGIRRASQHAQTPALASGWPALDAALPGGGFPLGAVTELLVENAGVGELSLLLPCLRQRMAALPGHRVGLIAPPHALQAPALTAAGLDSARLPLVQAGAEARIWAAEQMALSRSFAAIVLWCDQVTAAALRRLQLAAEPSGCAIFVYRAAHWSKHASPAALRLRLSVHGNAQRVEVLKCRGPAGAIVQCLRQGDYLPWESVEPLSPPFPNDRAHNDVDLARPAFHPLAPGQPAPLRRR